MTLANVDHETLADGFAGEIIVGGDPSYDEARTIFNAMIDRRPAVIAQCASTQDVSRAIGFARERSLEIAVRGGGHGVAGKALCDGGLVIDLRRMNTVTVDPDARTATVGGGATMSDLDRATQRFGLATTGGRVSTTGVAGLTLGGGNGWLDRKFGLACDNLLSVDLVTADGQAVHASDSENPELFWALHGGGGNFGVATSFTFRLDPLPVMTAAIMVWPAESGPAVLRRYRDVIESGPDDVGGGFFYLTGPPEDFVPAALVELLICFVLVTYTGPKSEAQPFIDAMAELRPAGTMVAEMSYADLNSSFDDPPGQRNYWSAEQLGHLPDAAVYAFCGQAAGVLVPSSTQHVLFPQGGASLREWNDWPTPFRNAPWVAHPFGVWSDPADDDRSRQWVRDVQTAMRPWATGDVYLNFIGDEGEDRLAAAYGPHYQRLARAKAEHDPDNVFHVNHNIKPAPAVATQR